MAVAHWKLNGSRATALLRRCAWLSYHSCKDVM